MEKSVNSLLKELFNSQNKKTTIQEFYNIVGTETGNSLTNALFSFINESIDLYDDKENLDYICNALNTMEIVLENNPDINRKSIRKKFKKIVIKIKLKKELIKNKELEKIEEKIIQVEHSIDNKECRQYKLLNIIINDTKNIEYLEETFYHLPNSVNALDKDGNTLFYNVLKKFIQNMVSIKDNKEEILYYNNVILLMENQKKFELKNQVKKDCLSLICDFICRLDTKDEEYKIKIDFLSEIKNSIIRNKDEKSSVYMVAEKYNIAIDFNNSILEELNIHENTINKENCKNRVYCDDYIITIDGDNAIEIDDGLSARKLDSGNYLLGVHIASPLSYIPYDSEIIKEAISRGSCIYFHKKLAQRIIPLFPLSFSSSSASLLPNLHRYAKSYYFELDKQGNIVDKKFLNTIIKSSKKSTYQEINEVIENGSNDKKLEETVNLLNEITYKLEDKYNPEDIYEDIKLNSINPANVKVGNSRAERIIDRTMLLTGNNVASFFADSNYPTLYRTHSLNKENIKKLEEEIKKITNRYDKESFNRLYKILLGIYPKAKYDITGSHDGLRLERYCHCTSPLRRSADIIVEHSLDVCYFSNPTDKEVYQLEEDIKDAKSIINSKYNDTELFLGEIYRQKIKKM